MSSNFPNLLILISSFRLLRRLIFPWPKSKLQKIFYFKLTCLSETKPRIKGPSSNSSNACTTLLSSTPLGPAGRDLFEDFSYVSERSFKICKEKIKTNALKSQQAYTPGVYKIVSFFSHFQPCSCLSESTVFIAVIGVVNVLNHFK